MLADVDSVSGNNSHTLYHLAVSLVAPVVAAETSAFEAGSECSDAPLLVSVSKKKDILSPPASS